MSSIQNMSAPRQFLVPKVLCASGVPTSMTLDDMEFVAARSGATGAWAKKVLIRENARTLDELLGEDQRLPVGVLASMVETGGAEVVIALMNHRGETWTPDTGWAITASAYDEDQLIDLEDNDVAFIVRALREGSTGVVMRAYLPLGFVSAAGDPEMASEGSADLPEGSAVVAIVDPLDKDAVLEMLAVAPGPVVYRRHAGVWHEDNDWVSVLASVKPPSMVKLTPEQITSVSSQVDAATTDVEFSPFVDDDRDMYVTASAYVDELRRESQQAAIDINMALVAVGGRELSPKDVASTERLKRYWTYGPGAAKIRWFQPGSWRRCYRNLVKYVGPKVAPGLCTNLSKRLGGPGIATHVGS